MSGGKLFHEFAVAAAGGLFAVVVGTFVVLVVGVGAFVEDYVAVAFK